LLLRSFQTATESTEAQKIQENARNSASVAMIIIFTLRHTVIDAVFAAAPAGQFQMHPAKAASVFMYL
jgi:hypothetical protein